MGKVEEYDDGLGRRAVEDEDVGEAANNTSKEVRAINANFVGDNDDDAPLLR